MKDSEVSGLADQIASHESGFFPAGSELGPEAEMPPTAKQMINDVLFSLVPGDTTVNQVETLSRAIFDAVSEMWARAK